MKLKQILDNHILSVSIGLVYLWFGALKFFPDLSPAETIAQNVIGELTFHLIPDRITIILLALWETIVGMCLLLNIYRKFIVIAALVHMVFTFTPFIFFPDLGFVNAPYQFTLLGQYIFKNVIIIAALITLYKLPNTVNKK